MYLIIDNHLFEIFFQFDIYNLLLEDEQSMIVRNLLNTSKNAFINHDIFPITSEKLNDDIISGCK